MQVRVKRQNVDQDELAKALSGYIEQEGISDIILTRLQKSHDHQDIIPEKYIRTIRRRMNGDYRSLMATLDRNIEKWFGYMGKRKRKWFLRKDDKKQPFLPTTAQVDNLKALIAAHFSSAVGITLSDDVKKRWKQMGIVVPEDDFQTYIAQSYVGGRISNILDNQSTYEDMLRQAKKTPMSRVDDLILQAAQQNAAKYVSGYGQKLGDLAEDMLSVNHKSAIHDVVQSYFSGDLTHTTYNEEGFTPKEAEQLLSTDKQVKGWRELSSELRNRFKAVDVGRDWDRIAQSEIRYATNTGRLTNIQIEGGGDPSDIEVYFYVQPGACKYCKELYLEPDGTPKIFKLSEILDNVRETGGMNVGRKASDIGGEDGWIPNATVHPNCHCMPVRRQPGYEMISPIGGMKSGKTTK